MPITLPSKKNISSSSSSSNTNYNSNHRSNVFRQAYAHRKRTKVSSPMSSLSSNDAHGPFDKVQLTKLLIDSLHEMGYSNSAVALQNESGGIEVESTVVQRLFSAVKAGEFDRIDLDMLSQLPLKDGDLKQLNVVPSSSGSTAVDDYDDLRQCAGSPDNMKIGNIISSDWKTVVSKMQAEYKRIEQLAQSLDHRDADALALVSTVVEILILINRQIFLELIFDQHDPSLAVMFLRNVLRRFIQLWDSLLTLQNNFTSDGEGELVFSPDSLLRQLTSALTCPPDSTEKSSVWPGSVEKSRQWLVDEISRYINPNDLVPRGRLITLLRQAIKYQRSQDILSFDECDQTDHDKSTYNLLQDNAANSRRIKFVAEKTLAQNVDEIWYLEFSPDGRYLASASADSETDRKVLVYDVEHDFQVYKVLAGHEQCVLYLSFSPDSKYLVSCPFNEDAKIYSLHKRGEPTDINEGKEDSLIAEVIEPDDSFRMPYTRSTTSGAPPRVWCCDWFHTERNRGRFVVGSPDRDAIIYDLNAKAIVCRLSDSCAGHGGSSPDQFPRVDDLKITKDDKYLLLMTHDSYVDAYDLSQLPAVTATTTAAAAAATTTTTHGSNTSAGVVEDDTPAFHLPRVSRLNVGKRMTCLTIPNVQNASQEDDSLVLVNVQPHELQLWDFKEQILVQKYVGQRQLQFIIRSCFGYDNKLIASGSEDGKVYIWDRFHGNIIGVLKGHTADRPVPPGSSKQYGKNCNTVVWNPVNKHLFASGGDDGLVKVWRVVRE